MSSTSRVTGGSFVKVKNPDDPKDFDYGFKMGQADSQTRLRSFAIHVVMIQLIGEEKEAVAQQFGHLPYPLHDSGPLVYYGDMAKFIARHLSLLRVNSGNSSRFMTHN
jgi:hypothetical protein